MAPTVPTVAPQEIVAGDLVRFTRQLPAFPVADGWEFTYTIAGPSKAAATAVTSSGVAEFTLPVAQTAELLPGTYHYVITATLGAARHTAESGLVNVLVDVASASAGSLESQDVKELRLLDAEIAARASSDHTEYAIDGRSLKREPLPELIAWRDRLRAKIARRRNGGRVGKFVAHFRGGSVGGSVG